MVAAIIVPSVPAYAAVADKIDVGQPAYNAVTGTMTYYNCLGTGSNLYKSLVINFTSVRTNGEKVVLPSMSGFNYETTLSTDGTYVINIPEGKNLVQIAAYIRKIQFLNCQNSTQKINFSIGKDIVQYMTFYSEDSQHYYQFIKFNKSGSSIKDPSGKTWTYGSWEWAYYTALNMKYEGLQGYLATVSTVEEDAFIYRCSNEIGWLGGTRMKRGAADAKNDIPYYQTFTSNAQASDAGIGYWYWACGPDVNTNAGKFLNATTATNTTLQSAESSGYYNNWNSGEPNNSGNEFVMTTLKIGSGWSTGNRNGKIGTSSQYYVSSGYSWNDIIDTNWAPYGPKGTNGVTDYTATGFFVEYGDYVKGLSKTALVQKTNFEFKTTTQPLSHIWNLYSPEGSDTINMYCSASDPKCSYYAVSDNSLGETIDLTISTADVPYDGKPYNSTSIVGDLDIKSAAGAANTTISDIKYFRVSGAGITSGGESLGSVAPTDIGYYYAQVDVSVKNTVLATNTVTAKAVSAFKIYDPDADFAVDSLNNNSNADTVPYQRKVTENQATSDLEVVLATSSDTLEMYKIAEMTWNDEENTLNKVSWVEKVQNWINNSPYASSAATPYDMANGKASSSTISSFYKDMLRTDDGVIIGKDAIAGEDLVELIGNKSGQYSATEDIYVDADGQQIAAGAEGATKYAVKFKDIKYGIYAILAKDGGENPYAVTVAAVYPQQSGPKGNYYVQDLFTVYIKEVEPTIEKFINGEKEDIIEINDTEHPIEFTVDFQLPQYKDRITSGTDSGYQLYFEDTMAPGFSLVEGGEFGEFDIQLYYLYNDGGELKEELIDRNNVPTSSPYRFGNAGDIPIVKGENAKEGTVDYVNILTKNTDLDGAYATRRENVRIFSDMEVIPNEKEPTILRINFDEPAIRAWKYDLKQSENREIAGFRLKYKAILDSDAKINSNANSNVATVHYEKDAAGSAMVDMNDTVYAYTYGLNIIKIDGSASERAYLAGAQFKLYKEITEAVTEEQATAYKADTEHYYVLPGDNETPERYFKKVAINNGVFTQGSTGEYDTLISVGNEKGITTHGLKDGKYVLVETKAPSGYNELAEDIYFEINRLTEQEEQLKTTDKSLKWFREQSDNYSAEDPETAVINQNACITIDVYNYQGLVLPSTGGMGILLFIIIGTTVMGTVIVIILNRRRTQEF